MEERTLGGPTIAKIYFKFKKNKISISTYKASKTIEII